MNYTYRKVKTASRNTGIQIRFYKNGNLQVKNHIGTVRNQSQLDILIKKATEEINRLNSSLKQLVLFKKRKIVLEKKFLKNYQPLEIKYLFAYRPISHWKPLNIQSHLLVSFMALSISKYIEISKNQSIKSYIEEIMKIKTLKLLHLESEQVLTFQV